MIHRHRKRNLVNLVDLRKKVISKNKAILERFMPLTMSDKMFLNSYTNEFFRNGNAWPNDIYPSGEIVGKFLMINYNIRDMSLIRKIVYNEDIETSILNEKIQGYCRFFEG